MRNINIPALHIPKGKVAFTCGSSSFTNTKLSEYLCVQMGHNTKKIF